MSEVRNRRARYAVAHHGTTYAEDAGITLRDKPSPLYRLLVLATLLSARISADIAVASARELSAAGFRTPQRMKAADGAARAGLPDGAKPLADLVPQDDVVRLVAACVRAALDDDVARAIHDAPG